MALYFDGTNDALVNTAWPVVDLTDGLTLACWFKVPAVATTRALFGISDSSSPYYSLYLQLDSSTLAAYTTDSTNYNNANKTGAAANVWSLAGGTYPSINSRTAWLNGSPGSAQTTSRTCASLDRITLGKRYYNGSATFGQANLAHVAVWRAVLTAAEWEWMYDGGRGTSPTLIRPDALICHYPLIENFNCSSGPLHLTREDSPLWTNDSERLLLPKRRFFWRPEWTPSSAGGTDHVGNGVIDIDLSLTGVGALGAAGVGAVDIALSLDSVGTNVLAGVGEVAIELSLDSASALDAAGIGAVDLAMGLDGVTTLGAAALGEIAVAMSLDAVPQGGATIQGQGFIDIDFSATSAGGLDALGLASVAMEMSATCVGTSVLAATASIDIALSLAVALETTWSGAGVINWYMFLDAVPFPPFTPDPDRTFDVTPDARVFDVHAIPDSRTLRV